MGWQEEHIQALLTIQSEHELFKALGKITHELGFDYCAYGLRTLFPVTRPKVVMMNNYPDGWQRLYQEKDYLAIDPTVHHVTHSPLPVIWSDDLFASVPEMWEDARSFELNVGWAQSSRDAYGAGGMLTLARSGEPLTDVELHDKGFKMIWLTQIAHLGMSHCLTAKLVPELDIRLTNRELDILKWTADGKTAGEISEILGISERTINFHISNAMEKLGTSNKLAAAVKAALLGFLC